MTTNVQIDTYATIYATADRHDESELWMHWILQDNLFNEAAYQLLLDTLVRFQIDHSVHKVIPFIGEITPAPALEHTNVICMGSYSLRHAAKKYGWTPGVFDLEPFDFTEQLRHWGDEMLNADSRVCKFSQVDFAEDAMFIRPIQDSKVFAGGVFERDAFREWQRKVCMLEEDYGNSLTGDTLVQVSSLKEIYAEYRFWIVDQKIVTSSLYKRGAKVIYLSQVDDRVTQYVASILEPRSRAAGSGSAPHDAYVIDVADTPQGMKIVEINTLNSCGFYAADMQKLVLALQDRFSHL